jgi:TRAP-type C4-dicarboxylate transport system substrate-binding protein
LMKTKRPLLERVKSRVASRPVIKKSWFHRLPPEVQEQLLAVRADWQAGAIVSTARGLARDLVEECRADGINTCVVDTMREWLTQKD